MRRTLTRLLLLIASISLAPHAAQAKDGAPDRPLTSYEAGPLRDAPLVVVGWTVSERALGGQSWARVRIQRTLKGKAPSEPLTVIIGGPRPTRSVRRRGTGFPSADSGRHVFFFDLASDSVSASFRDSFSAAGPVGEEKVDALAKEIQLAGIPDHDARAKETLAYVLERLDAKGRWTSAHAARELQHFARARRDLVDRRVEDRVAGLLASRIPREQRRYLQALQVWFSANPWRARRVPTPRPSATPTPPRRPDWQLEFLGLAPADRPTHARQVLARLRDKACVRAWWYFDHGDESTRLVALRHIGRFGNRDAIPRLRRAYVDDPSDEVRTEVVTGMGRLGDKREVEWVAERLANVQVRRSALLALARIRSTKALAVLETVKSQGTASGSAAKQREARWVAFLLSDAFEASIGGR